MKKIKITCTEKQKDELISSIMTTEYCPRFLVRIHQCKFTEEIKNCIDCLNTCIDWEITDEVTDNNCGTCKYKEQIKAIMDILKNAEKNKENENDKSSNRDT